MSESEKKCDISVIIPCLNEQGHIATTIDRMRRQIGAGDDFTYEVLIVDGGSSDGTIQIIERETGDTNIFRILENRGRTTPKAFNLGIYEAKGRYLSIISAHAEVADDYLMQCLETSRRSGADNVGGPRRSKGKGYVGKAIALAYQSAVAVGGAANHDINYEGELKTVPGGFYKKEVFEKIGLYDEKLLRNQDDELNLRLIRSGGRIWQSPKIRYVYMCRSNLRKLFSQYFQYGYWKIWVIEKHRIPASMRHLVPGIFVAGILALALLIPFWESSILLLTGIVAIYLAVILVASVLLSVKVGTPKYLPVLPVIFTILHVAYGTGFLFASFSYLASLVKRLVLGARSVAPHS